MNKLRSILAIATLLLSFGCKKKPIELLPPATQEGMNTLGCIIDGQAYFVHHNPDPSTDFNCRPKCYYAAGLGGSQIITLMCVATPMFNAVYIYLYIEPEEGRTYNFGEGDADIIVKHKNPLSTTFSSKPDYNGSFTITKLTDEIIAGTFSSSAIGILGVDSGKVITITDGRFDIKIK